MGQFDNVDLGHDKAMQRMIKAEQERQQAIIGECQVAFTAAVKAMVEWARAHDRSYVSKDNAAGFVKDLPEFWREPARVMASCGYYGSADGWMKEYVEG